MKRFCNEMKLNDVSGELGCNTTETSDRRFKSMARADKDHRAESADKAISPACNGRFRRASSAVSQALAFSGFPGHKDVILELQRRHGTEGGVGRIFEYVGPGSTSYGGDPQSRP
jgi:hypothetical protein